MLTLAFGTLLLVVSPSDPTTAQLMTIVLEPLDEKAGLPKAAVFFLPRSSELSPVAADVVARTARNAGSGTIVIIQTSSDNEAGETPKTAADRADVVRRELIRNGVSSSAIRVTHTGAFGTGIESTPRHRVGYPPHLRTFRGGDCRGLSQRALSFDLSLHGVVEGLVGFVASAALPCHGDVPLRPSSALVWGARRIRRNRGGFGVRSTAPQRLLPAS